MKNIKALLLSAFVIGSVTSTFVQNAASETCQQSSSKNFSMSTRLSEITSTSFKQIVTKSRSLAGAEIPLDLVRDGYPDIALLEESGTKIIVQGKFVSEEFKSTYSINLSEPAQEIAFGDFDNDNKPDLIYRAGNRILIRFNDGLSFAPSVLLGTMSDTPGGIALADFNGDAKLDISESDILGIGTLKGTGNRNLASESSWKRFSLFDQFIFTNPVKLQTIYPDSKTLPGLAVSSIYDGFLAYPSVFLHNTSTASNINFSVSASDLKDFGSTATSVVSADFNKDGKLDAAVLQSDARAYRVLLGNGTRLNAASFLDFSQTVAQIGPDSAAADMDLTAERSSDLIFAATSINKVGIVLNAAGAFSTPIYFNGGTAPKALAITDIDLDGDTDIVVANSGSAASQKGFTLILNLKTYCKH